MRPSNSDVHTSKSESVGVRTDGAEQPTRRGSLGRGVLAIAAVGVAVGLGFGAAVLALSVLLLLILIHEGGHYLAARACRMRVHQFFVGFGPVIWSRVRGETEYGIKAIPLGGYVQIAGMGGTDRDDPRGYHRAGRLRKLAVVAAGPVANLVTALSVSFIVLYLVGVASLSPTLAGVDAAGPAGAAGIRSGDRIVAIDGHVVDTWGDVLDNVIAAGPGSTVDIDVTRGERTLQYAVPVVAGTDGRARIGVVAGQEQHRESAVDALVGSVEVVRFVSTEALDGLGGLVTGFGDTVRGLFGGQVDADNRPLSPIGAIQVGTEVGGDSLENALTLVVLYSVFLAVFNLLPIPPLDGGHMAVIAVETVLSTVRRRRVEVSPAVVGRISGAFVVALLFVGFVALLLDLTQPIQL